MVHFALTRTVPLSAGEAWARLTHWEEHGRTVPFTRVREATPPPTAVGSRVVARTAVGRFGFDDIMEVGRWQPPEDGRDGVCLLVKRGRAMLGRAELTVHRLDGGRSRVRWSEDVRPCGWPPLLARPFARPAGRLFGIELDRLLATPA